LFALVLIVLGTYYLLRNTLGIDLPQLEGEAVAAFIAVLGGIALLLRAWQERSEPTGTEQLPRP
jgi:hypothetical protein